MFELTDERRKTLKSFLVNVGTAAFVALMIGAFAKPEGFALLRFVVGCILFMGSVIGCWFLDAPSPGEEK